jgi:anti-anti-sigma factor
VWPSSQVVDREGTHEGQTSRDKLLSTRSASVSEHAEVERDPFSVDCERDGSTLSLSLAGEFDWAVSGYVEGALERGCEVPVEHVVFDLSDVTFIDITALKVILKTHEMAAARGFDVTVVRPRGLVNRIFTLTRAAETLEMVDRV